MPHLKLSRRAPRRNIMRPLTCVNVTEAQGNTPRPDTTHNCATGGRLVVAADLPVE